jgi:L-lactate dehydrogenase complex protein LldE
MMKVALYVPCFVDQLMPHVAMDTVRVLRRIGCDIVFPEDQTCCGQPAFNTGQWDDARPCAERFARVFAGYEYIVCPSGSCTSMVRTHYPALLEHSPARQQAIEVGRHVYELSEFLVRVAKVTDLGASFPHSVTYHSACHANRELGVAEDARTLLKNVRGLELREMKAAEECCGFGGAFSVKFGMISAAMGDTKIGHIEATNAEYVTAVDPSCLMHIDGVLRKNNRAPKPIHIASILAQGAQ